MLTDPGLVGTFINEQDVAAAVGVSRTPVREALLRLAAEDLVQLRPNRGAFLAPLSTEQTRQVIQARGVIETWAARGDTLFIELTFEGSLGGRPLRWAGIDRITLKDGLATERVARFDPLPILAAVATRPRAWPRFARMRAGAVIAK